MEGKWKGGRNFRWRKNGKVVFLEPPKSMQPFRNLQIIFNYDNICVNFNPDILLREK